MLRHTEPHPTLLKHSQGYTVHLACRKEISMRPEQVAEVMHDPLAQELLHSAIPARMAYNGTDGNPRVIPVGFLWKNERRSSCALLLTPTR